MKIRNLGHCPMTLNGADGPVFLAAKGIAENVIQNDVLAALIMAKAVEIVEEVQQDNITSDTTVGVTEPPANNHETTLLDPATAVLNAEVVKLEPSSDNSITINQPDDTGAQSATINIEQLSKDYISLAGKEPDKRWGLERLQEEVNKLLAS